MPKRSGVQGNAGISCLPRQSQHLLELTDQSCVYCLWSLTGKQMLIGMVWEGESLTWPDTTCRAPWLLTFPFQSSWPPWPWDSHCQACKEQLDVARSQASVLRWPFYIASGASHPSTSPFQLPHRAGLSSLILHTDLPGSLPAKESYLQKSRPNNW